MTTTWNQSFNVRNSHIVSTGTIYPAGSASFAAIPVAGQINSNYAELSNNTVTFISNGKVLFTIMEDGRIAKGEGFTTTDEMSIEFWNKIAENFPVAWWKSLVKDRAGKP